MSVFKPLLATLAFALPATLASGQAQLPNVSLTTQLDTDMQNVVLLYDAIKGTPILDLSAPDARQQFAPEDAAKILARGFVTRVPESARSALPSAAKRRHRRVHLDYEVCGQLQWHSDEGSRSRGKRRRQPGHRGRDRGARPGPAATDRPAACLP